MTQFTDTFEEIESQIRSEYETKLNIRQSTLDAARDLIAQAHNSGLWGQQYYDEQITAAVLLQCQRDKVHRTATQLTEATEAALNDSISTKRVKSKKKELRNGLNITDYSYPTVEGFLEYWAESIGFSKQALDTAKITNLKLDASENYIHSAPSGSIAAALIDLLRDSGFISVTQDEVVDKISISHTTIRKHRSEILEAIDKFPPTVEDYVHHWSEDFSLDPEDRDTVTQLANQAQRSAPSGTGLTNADFAASAFHAANQLFNISPGATDSKAAIERTTGMTHEGFMKFQHTVETTQS